MHVFMFRHVFIVCLLSTMVIISSDMSVGVLFVIFA